MKNPLSFCKMGIFGFGASSVLFWPGCFSSAFLENKASDYRKILKKIGIKTRVENDLGCCGGVLINAGYDKESRKVAMDFFENLKKKGITKIITSCPLCYKTFSQDYKLFLPEWNIESEFILPAILKQLKLVAEIAQFNSYPNGKIVYKDACYLGRYAEIYDSPRELLKILGYKVIELPLNKAESMCCGSCGNLKQVNPELSKQIALDFIKQLETLGITRMVTADAQEYAHLKENLDARGIEILDFSEILCKALKI